MSQKFEWWNRHSAFKHKNINKVVICCIASAFCQQVADINVAGKPDFLTSWRLGTSLVATVVIFLFQSVKNKSLIVFADVQAEVHQIYGLVSNDVIK